MHAATLPRLLAFAAKSYVASLSSWAFALLLHEVVGSRLATEAAFPKWIIFGMLGFGVIVTSSVLAAHDSSHRYALVFLASVLATAGLAVATLLFIVFQFGAEASASFMLVAAGSGAA